MMPERKNVNKMNNEQKEQTGTYWWEAEGLLFECKQCGSCCCGEPGAIWVTPEEITEIADFLGISEPELRAGYLTRDAGRSSIREQENYDCVFLKRNIMNCGIYKARPLQCRLFPFWPSILRDKNIWNYYATRCPGMNQGKLYTSDIIKSFKNIEIWQDL